MTELNPVATELEFMGSIGASVLTPGLPLITISLYLLVNKNYLVDGVSIDFKEFGKLFKDELIDNFFDNFFDLTVWKVYIGWFIVLAILDVVMPGKSMKGTKLRDGSQLTYKINGKSITGLIWTLLISRFIITQGEMPELQFVYDNFNKLLYTTLVFSFAFSTFLYLYSFIPLLKPNNLQTRERILAEQGNSANGFYNWFIGRELNPRVFGSCDLKLYCETRPGLLLWFIINLSCLHHVYLDSGVWNDSLLVVNALQSFYIFDGVMNEEGLLTMMDIATDGFGFMLVFGDLTWVPFTYSLQCRYLSLHTIKLGIFKTILIILLQTLGFYIFRSANKQKSDFKMGKLSHLQSIKTKRGTNLLCDGWWGLSQHINYLGDWIIAWSWCLPTGFNTPITYFYVIYFGTLLLHRQIRDESKCKAKYGDSWDEYSQKVPYKIIPYIY